MLDELKEEIASLTGKAAGIPADEVLQLVELGKVGDLSSRIAFMIAKSTKQNPAAIAAELATKIKPTKNFEKIEATGPYINFYLSNHAYSEILSLILSKKESFGKGKKKKGKVIIEFPSVNPNKPWHIGHLRNALLGDSIARILEFDGYHVERMDYIDDLGLQVAQSLWGFLNFDSNPEGKFDNWLGHQYVGIAKKFEQDKSVVEGVRETLKSMEEGNNEIAQAGRSLAENCVRAQYETSFNFGIYHDVLIFESDIMHTIFEKGIDYIKNNDGVTLEKDGKNAGCWVVRLGEEFEKEFGKMENPDKVLIRSDGTAVYTGKDIIFHLWKFGKLKNFLYEPFLTQPNGKVAYKSSPTGHQLDFGDATTAINVIGVEQKYPQRVIVEVLRRLKFIKEAENLHHLSYEHVGLPDEKFSGRKGTWVGFTADELLTEAQSRVMEKIKLDNNEKDKTQIAKLVGVAAIKFSFLRTGSEKRITFKWEDALNMEGDSGPYLQYAYVRANGILHKTEEKPIIDSKIKLNKEEKLLIKKMVQLSEVVAKSSKERAPHHITQYNLELAADFSSFYTTSSVLNAEDKKIMKNRLAIVLATSIVLKSALGLLGIECPERM